ncbi:MAG: tRNA (adenosine(37)-N6)-threonylcarbamoyltransferase complex dimerization subunit type 1 TsaB [Planctomycetales bacterium]
MAQGPGSFTGLRVGVTTAKTFAYAAKTELVGVDTLQAIAASLPKDEPPIWSIMDAGRQQLFAARFKQQGESLICVEPTKILAIDQWLAGLNKADQVAGPALESLKNRLPEHVELTDQRCWQPQAQWVGRLGWQHYLDGQRTDCWEMVPEYFRKSAAEENTEKARSSAEPS